MRYRIRIEIERAEDRSYWDEVYEQIVEDINVPELVTIINDPTTHHGRPQGS